MHDSMASSHLDDRIQVDAIPGSFRGKTVTRLQHLHPHENGVLNEADLDDAEQATDGISQPPVVEPPPASFASAEVGPTIAPGSTISDGAGASLPGVGALLDATVGASGAVPMQVQQALNAVGLSVTGTGITVGVLSDSFNNLGGAAADEASGALPASVNVLKDLASGGTDEGRAMLQIVHDIAPGAGLAFYTAFNSEQDFAAGILALAAAGCKVICDDVSYLDEPFFQSGIVAQAIQTVEQEGVVYVTAAGNEASNAYLAAWTPLANAKFDGVALHDTESFNGSAVQTIYVGANSSYSVPLLLEWNQPYGAATSNLEILVFQNGKLVGTATNSDVGEPNNPWTGIELTGGATYQIAIENLSGPDPGLIKEIAAGDGIPVTIVGANTGTVFGHAMSPYAIAVGAVSAAATPAFGANPPISEYFSSSGAGTELLFDDKGNVLASPDLLKPVAVSGVDDVHTTVSGGLNDFYGTSAATPSVAAVAALMLQANGLLNPGDVENLLEDSAVNMSGSTTSNYSAIAGYGLIQANLAVQYATTDIITLDANHRVISGTHLADTFVGGPGDHIINGDGGSDTLNYSNAPAPVTVDLSAGTTGPGLNGYGGTDTFTGIANVVGSTGNDTLVSSLTAIDGLYGMGGNDLFVIYQSADIVNEPDGANGRVIAYADYVLPANVDTLALAGTATHATGNGDAGGDSLHANQNLASVLTGNSLNDSFVVYHTNDVVVGQAGSSDVVYAFADYTLPSNVDTLALQGSAAVGVGNSDAAGDTFYSDSGVDTLIGNSLHDIFVVNNAADTVISQPGSNDIIYTTVNFTLPSNVDTLVLTGTATQGAGNGDAAGDTIYSDAGVDTLVGHSLHDTFVVYNTADTVIGQPGSNDVVYTTVNFTLPSNVDTLFLTGAATQGVGNSDAAGDTLYSNAGVDTLVGHSQHDTFVINNAADTVVGQPGGNDIVYTTVNFTLPSNVDALILTGAATVGVGNSDAAGDTLYSDAGIDTLVGHSLHDSFVIGNAADTVVGQPGSNDVVYAIVDYVLPSNVDTLVLGGSATHGTANNDAAGDTLYANATAASTLVGGTADDALYVTCRRDHADRRWGQRQLRVSRPLRP
jgi:Ca2+-binding RTX toxin-like protein